MQAGGYIRMFVIIWSQPPTCRINCGYPVFTAGVRGRTRTLMYYPDRPCLSLPFHISSVYSFTRISIHRGRRMCLTTVPRSRGCVFLPRPSLSTALYRSTSITMSPPRSSSCSPSSDGLNTMANGSLSSRRSRRQRSFAVMKSLQNRSSS